MPMNEATFSLPELGASFSPFDLTVERGEDVLGRITSVALTGPDQGVCVLIAAGGASNFTVKQPGHDATLNYQGNWQVLRLHGLYLPMVHGGPITGRIKIVAGSTGSGDRQLIEGVVAGRLIAGSPGLKVSVGSFKVDFEMLWRMCDPNRVFDAVPILESRLLRVVSQSNPKRSIEHLPDGVAEKMRLTMMIGGLWLKGGKVLQPPYHTPTPIPWGDSPSYTPTPVYWGDSPSYTPTPVYWGDSPSYTTPRVPNQPLARGRSPL